jgi:hypothetical protein
MWNSQLGSYSSPLGKKKSIQKYKKSLIKIVLLVLSLEFKILF